MSTMAKPKKFTMRFGFDGSVDAVANDAVDWRKIVPGHAPKRASRVEVVDFDEISTHIHDLHEKEIDHIQNGNYFPWSCREEAMANADQWKYRVLDEARACESLTHYYVDFSPLADQLKDDRYRVCLAKTFLKREDAIAAELEWLDQHYVRGTLDRPLCYAAGGNTNDHQGHHRPVPDVS